MSKHDKLYLRMAVIWSHASYSDKRKVGALIVKDRRIISDGYNGMPAGFDNTPEKWSQEQKKYITNPEVLHAEANAILKLARCAESAEGATLYLTIPPCLECAKLIIQAGISHVVYAAPHKHEGLALLARAGITTEYLPL